MSDISGAPFLNQKETYVLFRDELLRLEIQDPDPASREFFRLLRETSERNCSLVSNMIYQIYLCRMNPTPECEHIIWLLFAAIQYVTNFQLDILGEVDPKYNASVLPINLAEIVGRNADELIDICSNKNLCTNIVRRYAGLKIVCNLLGEDKPFRVLDVGCSAGLGLMTLNKKQVTDVGTRADGLLAKYLNRDLEAEIFGIDVLSFDQKWFLACYLPEYKDGRDEAEHLLEELRPSTKVRFIEGDVRNPALRRMLGEPFDVVWTSNFCYQVQSDLEEITSCISSYLAPKGVWLNAYYRHQQIPVSSPHSTATGKLRNDYTVFAYPKQWWLQRRLEVLVSSEDRVATISRGADFDTFFGSTR